jgi:hypothetical protein
MQILMDIDGTIARQDDAQLILLFWKVLSLPPDTGPQLEHITELLALPQVQTARDRMGEKRFRLLMSMAQQSEAAIMSRQVVPGAYEARCQLAHLGQFRYCTVRKATYSGTKRITAQAIDTLNACTQRATHDWLTQQRFLYPEQVIFCRRARGKLEAIAACIRERERVLFVENELDAIVKVFAELPRERQAQIAVHTILLAFGYHARKLVSHITDLRCLALPSWDRLDDVRSALTEAGKDTPVWTSPMISQKMQTSS